VNALAASLHAQNVLALESAVNPAASAILPARGNRPAGQQHRTNLGTLSNVPVASLLVILIGLPLAATTAGWLLAGHQPPAIARQPIE
jgi:hypothetical protein